VLVGKVFYEDQITKIYCGHALEVLRELPDESVQMVITSPPYWGLRNYAGGDDIVWGGDPNCDHVWEGSEYHEHREEVKWGKTRTSDRFYGEPSRKFDGDHQRHYSNVFCVKCDAWKGQLGLEPSPELYVEHLMMIFREVKRVLRRDGSFYLNIGDTYAGSGCGTHDYRDDTATGILRKRRREIYQDKPVPQLHVGVPAKCMVCIPERVMFALIEEGFILRNKLIWRKPNALPGSQKDRFTTTWEYVYFFTKSNKTLLWHNKATGEWRDTEPTKEEKYPWGGRYRNIYTGEMRWDKPADMADWEHLVPIWQGFDYYFDLDAIRIPHKTQSLERYQRGVNLGRPAQGKSGQVGPMQEYIRAPKWFQEMFPPDEDYKGKFDDLFGHGPNPQSFNLRVRDVKRGKGGVYVEGSKVKELKASEREIEEYEYPEKPNWRREAAKKGQLFNNPVVHQGGENTGLKKEHWVRPSRANVPGRDELGNTIKKHHGSSHNGRAGLDRAHFKYHEGVGAIQHREGMDGIVAPLHPKGRNPGDIIAVGQPPTETEFERQWKIKKESIYGDDDKTSRRSRVRAGLDARRKLTKHDQAVGRTGNVSYTDPLHTRDYSPKGKNPGDILTERQENIISHFEQKGSGGHYLYGGLESPEGKHEYPLGKNPGDFLEITTQPYRGAHFAVYPPALVEPFIKASSRVGDTVLDPFCGSGTTGVVAKKLGRKAILIDCVESYCAMSRDRIKKVEYQPGLPLGSDG